MSTYVVLCYDHFHWVLLWKNCELQGVFFAFLHQKINPLTTIFHIITLHFIRFLNPWDGNLVFLIWITLYIAESLMMNAKMRGLNMNVNSCWCWSWWSRRHNDPAGPMRVFRNSGSAFSQPERWWSWSPPPPSSSSSGLDDHQSAPGKADNETRKERGERKLFRPLGSETPPIITARTPLPPSSPMPWKR